MNVIEKLNTACVEVGVCPSREEVLSKAKLEQLIKEEAGNPVSAHCQRVLEAPPPCTGFKEVRAWVLCRSWEKMEQLGLKRLPVGEAWKEVSRVCYLTQAEIPEKKKEIERLRGSA